MINTSNDVFARVLGESINNGYTVAYSAVKSVYGKLAEENTVAEYNVSKWYLA